MIFCYYLFMNREKKALVLVSVQGIFLLAILISPFVFGEALSSGDFFYFGAALVLSGGLFFAYSLYCLGKATTPSPIPNQKGELVTNGAYRFARHPVYTALIITCFGWSLIFLSLKAAVLSILLLFHLIYKSSFEEEMLIEFFGKQYLEYQKSTGKFTPIF